MKNIIIEVIDQGIGISEAEQSKLFSPFFKSSDQKSKEKNPSGNGLGLGICQKIAKALNGDLKCTSKVDEGSIFTFTFLAKDVGRV